MLILGIETSCDETAAAIVQDGTTILASAVNSQVDIHARYGGVVPEVASRQHLLSITPVIDEALRHATIRLEDLSAVAVTWGPGLAGSLLVGVNTARAISFARQLPLVMVNHLEAHLYANWLNGNQPEFPLICLIVSGGHTDLVLMKDHGDYTMLGQTLDDAAGEAFDKAARILGLGYPGGPAIDRVAEKGKPDLKLPRAWLKGSHDFSFSGIKTALLRLHQAGHITSIENAAASFQQAVVEVLVNKTIAAVRIYHARSLLLSGGVACNRLLRQQVSQLSPVPVLLPPPGLCTDNAAMVAACGYYVIQRSHPESRLIDVKPCLELA
jgi:N6-L-threonylcarbamoyladenine synthase